MCGILFACHGAAAAAPIDERQRALIARRGPDSFSTASRAPSPRLRLALAASVLALRGGTVAAQPLGGSGSGSALCWNGEAWRLGARPVPAAANDAELVFDALQAAARSPGEAPGAAWARVRAVLAYVDGPFAFVFYDEPRARVFFGRDVLGRRSLVLRHAPGGLVVASVGGGGGGGAWAEVGTQGICELDLCRAADLLDCGASLEAAVHVTPWTEIKQPLPPLNKACLPTGAAPGHADPAVVAALRSVLAQSVATRLVGLDAASSPAPAAPLAVLFSGGLDCSVLARLAHDVLPADRPVDLLNVAFENPRVVAAAARNGHGAPAEPPFERCPDRVTGRATHAELRRVCPGRAWNFVAVDVPYELTAEHRGQVVALMHPHDTEMDLSIALALYFAARACGSVAPPGEQPRAYESRAKVLFSGLGADELFGGYGRHAVAYERGGEAALAAELELDFERIGTRNLGRDDRVVAHWGREVRYPFLDEELVAWALQQPVRSKCDFAFATNPDRDPAKGVLREVARGLGMGQVAEEKKRAIQFGARTARMEQTRVKGTQKLAS